MHIDIKNSPLLESGIQNYYLKNYQITKDFFDRRISESPKDHYAYFLRGRFGWECEKDLNAVIDDFSKAYQLNRNLNYYYLYTEATKSEKNENYLESIKILTAIIKQNNFDSFAYYFRAILKDEHFDNYKEAISDYRKSIFINPKNPHVYWHYGRALRRLGYYQQAINIFNKYLELLPNEENNFNEIWWTIQKQAEYPYKT